MTPTAATSISVRPPFSDRGGPRPVVRPPPVSDLAGVAAVFRENGQIGHAPVLLIDNYDSFTWNLVHHLAELGVESEVVRNDAVSVDEALARKPQAMVLSPGPCAPDQAGICLELLARAPADLPILGVCLGHQAMGQAFGGRVVRAKTLMHGKTSPIRHDGASVFRGLPDGFAATRYHSLAVERDSLPEALEVTAWTEDGEIMGLAHRERPIHGVQFHPESIATPDGLQLLANFLDLAGVSRSAVLSSASAHDSAPEPSFDRLRMRVRSPAASESSKSPSC